MYLWLLDVGVRVGQDDFGDSEVAAGLGTKNCPLGFHLGRSPRTSEFALHHLSPSPPSAHSCSVVFFWFTRIVEVGLTLSTETCKENTHTTNPQFLALLC